MKICLTSPDSSFAWDPGDTLMSTWKYVSRNIWMIKWLDKYQIMIVQCRNEESMRLCYLYYHHKLFSQNFLLLKIYADNPPAISIISLSTIWGRELYCNAEVWTYDKTSNKVINILSTNRIRWKLENKLRWTKTYSHIQSQTDLHSNKVYRFQVISQYILWYTHLW